MTGAIGDRVPDMSTTALVAAWLDGIKWGTAGEWVGGLGALAAVGAALGVARNGFEREDQRTSEERQLRAQERRADLERYEADRRSDDERRHQDRLASEFARRRERHEELAAQVQCYIESYLTDQAALIVRNGSLRPLLNWAAVVPHHASMRMTEPLLRVGERILEPGAHRRYMLNRPENDPARPIWSFEFELPRGWRWQTDNSSDLRLLRWPGPTEISADPAVSGIGGTEEQAD